MQALQIVKEKPEVNQNMNFLVSSAYDVNDLRNKISPNDKFVIRQGDLIVTNYIVDYPRRRGLREAWLVAENGVAVFRDSHIILETKEFVSVFHPEHGLVVLPREGQRLNYYTIETAFD